MRMETGPRRRLRVVLAVAALAAGCDSTGPDAPDVAGLTVSGVRIDSIQFHTTGDFELGLLATDPAGRSILSTGVEISASVASVGGGTGPSYSIAVRGVNAMPAGNSATSAAILLDDSGSMSTNDRLQSRAAAAQLFWEAVLPARASNQVSLLAFGGSRTLGFDATRLLQEWTRSDSALVSHLGDLRSFGGTPLYESVLETAVWVDSTVAAGTFDRVMLVLTDGQPDSPRRREDAIAAANDAGIVIHTVGLGPASDAGNSISPAAVAAVRELAERTGGVYSSATDAEALRPIFQTLAQVSSEGQLIGAFRISPTPPSGTRVSGTVTVVSGEGTETANWSFVAP